MCPWSLCLITNIVFFEGQKWRIACLKGSGIHRHQAGLSTSTHLAQQGVFLLNVLENLDACCMGESLRNMEGGDVCICFWFSWAFEWWIFNFFFLCFSLYFKRFNYKSSLIIIILVMIILYSWCSLSYCFVSFLLFKCCFLCKPNSNLARVCMKVFQT